MRRIFLLLGAVLIGLALAACGEPPRPTINLYRAVHSGDLDQIKRHLYWGTEVNQPGPDGDYPLHVAVRKGRVVITRELVEHGADVTAKNAEGRTALHVALAEGKTQVAQVLVDAGGAQNLQPLLFSLVREGVSDRDTYDFLLRHGAEVNALGEDGLAPLHIAARDGQLRLAKRLIDAGADVDLPDRDGRTPLAIARAQENRDVVDLLERYGARPAAGNAD